MRQPFGWLKTKEKPGRCIQVRNTSNKCNHKRSYVHQAREHWPWLFHLLRLVANSDGSANHPPFPSSRGVGTDLLSPPQTKFAKVMFSQVFVCPQRDLSPGDLCPGGVSVQGVSVQRWVSVQGESLSRGSLSKEGLCPEGSLSGQSLSRGSLSRGSLSRVVSVRETPYAVTRGRYASYWNAFLFAYIFSGGSRISQRGRWSKTGVQTYYLGKFYKKTAWTWRKLEKRGNTIKIRHWFFSKNRMKLKEFGPRGCVSLAWIRHWWPNSYRIHLLLLIFEHSRV